MTSLESRRASSALPRRNSTLLHCVVQVYTCVAFETVAVNVRRSQRHFFVGSTAGALLQFALVGCRCSKQAAFAKSMHSSPSYVSVCVCGEARSRESLNTSTTCTLGPSPPSLSPTGFASRLLQMECCASGLWTFVGLRWKPSTTLLSCRLALRPTSCQSRR